MLLFCRGNEKAFAYTNEAICPHEIGNSWKYSGGKDGWKDAGDGLKVICISGKHVTELNSH